MIRTLVAAHVHVLRIGLVSYLSREPDIDVVSELDRDDRLLAVAQELTPSVAIMDVDLPYAGGPAAVTGLRTALPDCACVLLVGRDDARGLSRALDVRPHAVLSTAAPAELLTRCVRRVVTGRTMLDPELSGIAQTIGANPFTSRERQVLRLAADGVSTAEIATRLCVTPKTVRNHLSRLSTRIGARNRVDAIRIAAENEWI